MSLDLQLGGGDVGCRRDRRTATWAAIFRGSQVAVARSPAARRRRDRRQATVARSPAARRLGGIAGRRYVAGPEPMRRVRERSTGVDGFVFRMVDFPTVYFFSILVSFLSFSDFKKNFKKKKFEKKIQIFFGAAAN